MYIGYYYYDNETHCYCAYFYKDRKYITTRIFESIKQLNNYLVEYYKLDEINMVYMGSK